MDNETLRLLISCGTTVLVAIITQIFIYIVTKLNNKDSKKNSILEEQYEKVFAPIHKAIFYDNIENRNRLYWEIDHIISTNYPIVPKRIRELYSDIKDKGNSEFESFKKEISICFRYLSSILGYSREKLSRDEKNTAKKMINRKSEDWLFSRVAIVIAIFDAFLFGFIYSVLLNCFESSIHSLLISFGIISIFSFLCVWVYYRLRYK